MPAVQGQSYTFLFPCVASANPATKTAPTWAAGDAKITKPGGAGAVNTTNLPTNIGSSGNAQLVLTAAEMGIGLTDGQVGEVLIEITNAVMIPLLGVSIEIQATAPGALTAAQQAAIASAVDAAVADNFTAVLAAIAALPAAPSSATIASAVDAAVANDFTAVLNAIAAIPTPPSSGAIASAVDAAVADNFAAIPNASQIAVAVDAAVADNFAAVTSAISGIPAAPTASAVALAVKAVAVDGARTLGDAVALAAAMLVNAGTFPTTAAGGPITVRNAANTANLLSGSIDAAGVRTSLATP